MHRWWVFRYIKDFAFASLPQSQPPQRRHCALLTSVLPRFPAQQSGCLRGQQWTSCRGVLQQHLQLLQLRVTVHRGQGRGASQGLRQEQLRFGRCHLSGGRRARGGGGGCGAKPLPVLLTTGLFLQGYRADVRSRIPWRGALAVLTRLLLRGTVMPWGSQCWSVLRSGLRPPGSRDDKMFSVICGWSLWMKSSGKENNNNNSLFPVGVWWTESCQLELELSQLPSMRIPGFI